MPLKPSTRAFRPYFCTATRGAVSFKFWFRGRFRGVGLPSVWRVRHTSVGVGYIRLREGQMPERPSVASLVSSGAEKGSWVDSLPTLAGWLCDSVYPDGEPVGPTQLQVKRDGPLIRATLKIADQGGLKMSAVGENPSDALVALELVLTSDRPPWEKDGYPLAQLKAKKK